MKPTSAWISASNRQYVTDDGSSAFVPLEGYTAEVHETGAGSPIVLIPGLAGGLELLGPLTQSLASEHRVIRYQLRAEHDCFMLRHEFNLDDLVEDLAQLLDSLRLESPTLMGVSFGGLVALKFAIRYPYRVGRLVVQGAGARFEKGLLQQVASTVLSRFPLPADNPFVNQFFNLLFGGKQKQDALFDFVTRQIWQTDQSVMAHRMRIIEELDFEHQLARIQAPTLILSGDRDVLVSRKSLGPLAEQIRNASLVRVPNAGHLAFVSKPEALAAHVKQFVPA